MSSPDGRRSKRFAEERGHARFLGEPERQPAPTSSVMRLTAEYVPFMKSNRKVDFDKVQHTL